MLKDTICSLGAHELKTQIDADVNWLLQEDLLHFQQDLLHFQQDSTPIFSSRPTIAEWSIPELGPSEIIGCFLWAHLKSFVYKAQPADICELKGEMKAACLSICYEVFRNAFVTV